MSGSQITYRPDIDGLRAIAVLSVVLYHLQKDWLPGGFVGVDVFFVISGFLITRNIWSEIRDGRFTLSGFYLRRIRRIAPASLAVIAATLCAGILLMQPDDMERLARSAVWSALSAANIFYWKFLDTSYFAESSDQEPLLHMWSLGVEEQFYLVWPVLLLFMMTMAKRRWAIISVSTVIGIAAFVVAQITMVGDPKFSFFMLPARAGELMLGAVLALSGRHNGILAAAPVRRWAAEIVAILGFGLLGFSLWYLDDAKSFPGVNALYPCVGALLLILAGQLNSSLVKILLTPKPIVFIGLISYSLYLWHWPILAFIRYFYGSVELGHAVVAVIATVLLSIASYRWIEQPARRMRGEAWKQVGGLLVAPVLLVVIGGALVIRTDGIEQMAGSSTGYHGRSEVLKRQTNAVSRRDYPCQTSKPTRTVMRDERCVLGSSSDEPAIMLWGDSNAGHYIGVLKAVAERGGFAFRYLAVPTCPPVFGPGDFGAVHSRESCLNAREEFRRSLANSGVRTIVLAGQWNVHDKNPEFSGALQRTIADLRRSGVNVIVLAQVPLFRGYVRECEIRWARFGVGNCAAGAVTRDKKTHVNRKVERMATENGAAFLDIRQVLCNGGRCSPYLGGQPVYFNPTHLSQEGSELIGEALVASDGYQAWLSAFRRSQQARAVRAERDSHVPGEAMTTNLIDSRLQLPVGYQPSFDYRLRSQRHDSLGGGTYRHVVILEYIGREDADGIADEIASFLSVSGLDVDGPVRNGPAYRYLAKGRGIRLSVDVRPDPEGIMLFAEGGRGIVHFGWREYRDE